MDLILDKSNSSFRDKVQEFEKEILKRDGSFSGDNEICPLNHYFTDGIYTREIFIPKGMELTGKIHKHEHPNFLMKGKVVVVTENGGQEYLEAPLFMISPSGTKRVVRTLEDTVWITVHHNPTNTGNMMKLEERVIAVNYNEYERFKALQNKSIYKLYKKIINYLK